MRSSISVIIPACDAATYLPRCLHALGNSALQPLETIVIDDGSKDSSAAIAHEFGATVIATDHRSGPARARNLGAQAATGDIVFFLDADVCVKHDTLLKIARGFDADPELDALMGSYDSDPYCPDFISQYRNLMHCFVHQQGEERASTFWSGCGAIRRGVFLEHSGFSESYGRPAIEDIELGYRLIAAGRKILLDRSMLVTHLKKWTFAGLVKTDILDRGIPWTELIMRDRRMPNDLNLQLSQRVSVALVFILMGLAGALAYLDGVYMLLPLFATVFLMLARWWGEIGSYRRPRRAFAILATTIFFICVVAYRHGMYGLLPPLLLTPVFLLLRHRYHQSGRLTSMHRWYGIFFICFSVAVAAYYLPAHHLIFACFAVSALLGLLNSQFYIFLAGKRGIAFMLCAIPFHLLYHFYNGLSFIAGVARYVWMNSRLPHQPPAEPSSAEAHHLVIHSINRAH
jgi:glycosyltransferase involved in cell wall biosynthesis